MEVAFVAGKESQAAELGRLTWNSNAAEVLQAKSNQDDAEIRKLTRLMNAKCAEIEQLKAELITLREAANAIQAIADWLDSSVEYQQDAYDEPPSPRNEFDYTLYQAGSELASIARNIKGAAMAQAVQPT